MVWGRKRTSFCDTYKGYEIQISVSTHDVLLEVRHARLFISRLWLPPCYNSTEITELTEAKYLQEKIGSLALEDEVLPIAVLFGQA